MKFLVISLWILLCPTICFSGSSLDYVSANLDYLSIPDNTNLDMDTGDFSIAFWINSTASSTFQVILCKDGATGSECSGADSNTGYRAGIAGNGTDAIVLFIADDSTGIVTCSGTTDIVDGNWHFIVLNYDRDANGIIYVDNGSGEGACDISGQASTIGNSGALEIGRRGNAGGTAYYDGNIAWLQIYKGRILNAQERSEIYYKPCSLIDGLQLCLPMMGNTKDLSSNNFTVTNNGADISFNGPPVKLTSGGN